MRLANLYIAAAVIALAGCTSSSEYDACGTFEADEILVSSQAAGQLLHFNVREGDLLTPEKELGLVDTLQIYLQKTQIEAQLKSLESSRPDINSQVAALNSQLANLKNEKARIEKLVAKGAVPSKQLDDVDAQIDIVNSQIAANVSSLSKNTSALDHNAAALESQILMLEDKLDKCRIVSPAEGTVLARYVNAGELVNFGTPLFKVADLNAIYLKAYFTSDQLASIQLGQEVDVRADYGGNKQFQYKGKIIWISSESEFTPKAIQTKNTRANLVYAVKIAVPQDGHLKIGMYGEVNL